jgi:hypothetical protein
MPTTDQYDHAKERYERQRAMPTDDWQGRRGLGGAWIFIAALLVVVTACVMLILSVRW